MADYYDQSVITEAVYLTDELRATLERHGGHTYPVEHGEETILDGIVHEREPLKLYHVTFDEGWTGDADEFEDLEEWADWNGIDLDEVSDEEKRLAKLDKLELLREVAKLNPKQQYIEMQTAFTCSRMRLDGFGGSGIFVSTKGYLLVTTSNVSFDPETGSFKFDGEFTPFDEEGSDEQSEAA